MPWTTGRQILAIVGAWAVTSPALAQQNAVTVQLPTFSFFTVSTTVLVPDRGGAAMGGIGRSSLGANQFGPAPLPAGTRSIGAERQAQNLQVFVHVHDFKALEQAMGTAGVGGGQGLGIATGEGSPLSSGPVEDVAGRRSVADWRRIRAAESVAEQREALELVERGLAAAEAGNQAAAKIYLRMAYRRANSQLRPQILSEIQNLERPQVAERP